MTTWLIVAALYFAFPILGILISGRSIVWQGWILFLLFWPVLWMFEGPEELP